MKTYNAMKEWTEQVLFANGITDVTVYPGPDLPDIPDRTIIWTPYGGPGMILDGAMDAKSWQARVIGNQMNYDSAESLAILIDEAMISHRPSKVGGFQVSDINRVGGSPTALLVDDGDRTHFVCSYIVSVELALPN